MGKIYDLNAVVGANYEAQRLPSLTPTYQILVASEDGQGINVVIQLAGLDKDKADTFCRVIESGAPMRITFSFDDVLGVGDSYEYNH